MRARLAAPYVLCAACSAGPPPMAAAPVPLGPSSPQTLPAPPPLPTSPVASLIPPSSNSAAPAPATPPGQAATTPTPQVLLEPAYSALGHARLATEMLTLARDEELLQWALGGSADPAHISQQANFHPATRVVVDVELQSRAAKGTTNKLLRIARSDGYWPLRACFETAERLAKKRERSAKVRLTLSASGKVLGSRSLGAAAEPDYARCVLTRVRGLDFRPGFGRKLDVDISVKQWPGHAPMPPRAPDQAAAFSVPPSTSAALEGLSPALSACYTRGLTSDPALWGRIAFHLLLDDSGRVVDATPVETRFPSADVVTCARQALLGARLPEAGVSELCFAFRLGQPPAPPPPAAGAPAWPEGAPPIEPAH